MDGNSTASGMASKVTWSNTTRLFLWCHLKTVVYAYPPENLQDLKNKITVDCRQLTKEQILAETHREVICRLGVFLEQNGGHFEHLIR